VIRALSLLSTIAFVGAILLLEVDGAVAPGVVLILLSMIVGVGLAIRRGFLMVRDVVKQIHAFARSDVQHVRVADVGEPKGLFFPKSEVVLEFEGTDGSPLRYEHELPVPFFAAWSYRLSRRFNLPLVGRRPLADFVAFELRREGLDVDVTRRAGAEDRVALVREAFDHFRSHGSPPDGLLANDFELHQADSIMGTAGVFKGKNAWEEALGELGQSFDELTYGLDRIEQRPDGRVAAAVRVTGRGRSSDIDVENTISWLLTLEGRQISELRVFEDPDEAFA
jgi:ketosteroid isomerase-like protein